MAMELEYDRSLYGVEHKAGPFEISNDTIDRAKLVPESQAQHLSPITEPRPQVTKEGSHRRLSAASLYDRLLCLT